MQRTPVTDSQRQRIEASVPFVEALARRMAASMPNSIELGDLVQSGMIGLIDAAHRFAERRVRGAIIDALRRDAWPRGVRRMRRQLEAAREELRRELGHEPSLSDLAGRVGSDESRLGRTIVRINTIESTSPMAVLDESDGASLPPVLLPSEPPSPHRAYEAIEVEERVRAAIASLPPRERRVIGRYYFDEATMKQIGSEIGVNESRVSQLHARAVQRLRKVLAADTTPLSPAAVVSLAAVRGKLGLDRRVEAHATATAVPHAPAAVLPYPATSRAVRTRSASLKGFGSHRQPEVSRNRPASVPATSPVTKTTRRDSAGAFAAIAR
jgi:RNA polymerase sigma factor for flagellar operon FliA